MKRFIIFIYLTLLVCATALQAQVNFTVKPPSRVYEGQRFPVTFRLTNADGSDLKVSQINGCSLLYGPSVSQSQSYQVVNGKASSTSATEYTYYYKADKAGTFTIPAASIVADGKHLSTKAVTFTVHSIQDANTPASQRPVDFDDVDTQAAGRRVNSDDVFVRIILSKSSAYEQEAIGCTIKLYTKYSISSFLPTRQPAFDGFLIQEVDVQPSLNQMETYNGQNYMTAVLKKCIIFPQKSGKLTINSGNYDISVVQYDNVNMGMFQVRQPKEAKIKVNSNSASINILPLPQPQPNGFTGAVGTFNIDSRLIGNSFRTNDPATLIYTISGTGNIKYVKEPVIDFPTEFEQYTPKNDIDAEVQGNDVTGRMTVEYTFVPQSVGDFTIGSNKFVYFNPQTKQYVTLNTPSYLIKVAKGVSAPVTTDQKDVENKNSDIRHIYLGDKNPMKQHHLVVFESWYWILYIGLLIVAGAVLAINRRNARLNADVTGRRTAKASKVARRRLKAAEGFMKSGDSDKFYEEMLRAIWGYLSDKLSMPVSQLSRDNISATLASKGYSEENANAIVAVLDDCEMARYTPDSSSHMDSVYERGVNAINKLESNKK
ncbi:MAG: protein BatD [Muribaculaceae bacterium]|uniref:Protein BatD n=1 Tax=Duncaniella dubosii TaxID=2518971 RepID=A0A4P7W510_9BACT|nr:BatD family protein [Duncaniella dubosii]MBJ2190017.1 protein BatD [Muribaculaceae bacterium]QCD43107.1 protein BatD [Duncaniella dubosii]